MLIHHHFLSELKYNLVMNLFFIPLEELGAVIWREQIWIVPLVSWNRSAVIVKFYLIKKMREKKLSSPLLY